MRFYLEIGGTMREFHSGRERWVKNSITIIKRCLMRGGLV